MTRKSAAKSTKATPKLTFRQRAFVAEYIKDHNATQAAIRAGYNPNSAYSTAHELLKHPEIAGQIQDLEQQTLAKVQAETGITLERTLREIAKGAFHDPRKFFDEHGNLKQITDLDDETAASLAGFDVTEEFEGQGKARTLVGFTKKIKLSDRKGYLDMLMKHLGGYKEDNEQSPKSAMAELLAMVHESGSRLPLSK